MNSGDGCTVNVLLQATKCTLREGKWKDQGTTEYMLSMWLNKV